MGLGQGAPRGGAEAPGAHSRELGGDRRSQCVSFEAGKRSWGRFSHLARVLPLRVCSFARVLLLRETGMRGGGSPRHRDQKYAVIHGGGAYTYRVIKQTRFRAMPKSADALYSAQGAL